MEGPTKLSGKKQKHKNQRDKRNPQDKQGESSSGCPAAGNNAFDPQPQRSNRRQRNETVTPKSVVNSVEDSTPPTVPAVTPAVPGNKEKAGTDSVTIDFSNLKRETEEIARLTKKFAKRNISSNWHRYIVPEGGEDDSKGEEDGPADFSALIQVPASRGGHLQLKDEQEWSSASGEQLGGCFALNLRLLSQSLACVPAYKRLSLPKHMFSEDELKRFDNLARQANEAYNPDKIEEPNTKVMKTLTNLLQRDFDVVEEPEATNDTTTLNDFNILDVNKSNKKLLNISIESKIMPENTQVNNSNSIDDVQFNLEQNKSSFNPVNKNKTEKQINTTINCNNEYLESGENHIPIISNPMDNKVSKTDKIFEENVSTVSKTQNGNPEKQLPTPSQTIASDDVTKLTDQSVDNSKLPINEAQEDMTKETEQRSTVDPDCLIVNEPKGQRTKINRKTTVTDDVEKKSNTAQKILVLEDDDDDDLDRLLSLRKPVNSEKKEFKTVQSKNSGAGLQSASAEPNSELDDWLDSVLQN